MATLNATAGSSTANSFATQAAANDYLTTERLYADEWVAATSGQKDAALMWATRLLGDAIEWDGGPTTVVQALPFPRSGLVDKLNNGRTIDPNTIPTFLVRATADLAQALLKRNRTQDSELVGQGIASASVGELSVTVNPLDKTPDLIPMAILVTLTPYGAVIAGASGSAHSAPLRRT